MITYDNKKLRIIIYGTNPNYIQILRKSITGLIAGQYPENIERNAEAVRCALIFLLDLENKADERSEGKTD